MNRELISQMASYGENKLVASVDSSHGPRVITLAAGSTGLHGLAAMVNGSLHVHSPILKVSYRTEVRKIIRNSSAPGRKES
jgi:hypothetical protein